MNMAEEKRPYEILSVQRALVLLSAFCQKRTAMSLPEICKNTGLSKSTAFRLIVNLQSRGFLAVNETGKYVPGPEIERLAAFADSDLPLRRLVYPYICFLSEVTKETVLLTKLKKDRLYCIEKIESKCALRITAQVGAQMTMARGATGTSVAAFLDDIMRPRVIENERCESSFEDGRDIKILQPEYLEAIRIQGFALSQGEVDAGVISIAAPFFDSENVVRGSISIAGPGVRFTPVDAICFESLLRLCCRNISKGIIFTEEFRGDGLKAIKRIHAQIDPYKKY